jgi:hypothetical protein
MPCMNWKLIAAVIAGGILVAITFPGAAAAVLPLLILAVCPLAMIVGMAVLGRSGNQGKNTTEIDELRAEVARLRGDTPTEERLA